MMLGISIEGFAIVSREGMVAAADGFMPNSLKFDQDQDFLDRALDDAVLLVHGRLSHEGQPNSPQRRRLLLTRSCGAFSTQPVEPYVWHWNPETTPFPEVCKALGVDAGVVAVLGGTAAYDMFLPFYGAFHLCRANKVSLPGGVPVLSAVRNGCPPDEVLSQAGLKLQQEVTLDPGHELKYQSWRRA
jgi:hypothetical protein